MRAVSITGLLIVIMLFMISSFDDLTRLVNKPRSKSMSWWGSGRYPYGDLYGMSYLPQFKIAVPNEDIARLTHPQTPATQKNTDLYALSDSYLWGMLDHSELFSNINRVKYVISNTRNVQPVILDTTKRNVLLIEVVERNIRPLFSDSSYLSSFLYFYKPGEDTSKIRTAAYRAKFHFKFKIKEIDPNIEYNVWDYRFLSFFKEANAGFTYRYFGRTNKDVVLSDNGKQLFYSPTIDTASELSSFNKVTVKEINALVNNLNAAAAYYKKQGFDEVYLSMIPNAVTIMQPQYHGLAYNQLIPKLQNHPALQLKVINSYSVFKQSKSVLYLPNDTHWNYKGKQLWLNAFNEALIKR